VCTEYWSHDYCDERGGRRRLSGSAAEVQADSPDLTEDGAAFASAVLNRLRVTVNQSTWRSTMSPEHNLVSLEGTKAEVRVSLQTDGL
jgi:hypothetical protein